MEMERGSRSDINDKSSDSGIEVSQTSKREDRSISKKKRGSKWFKVLNWCSFMSDIVGEHPRSEDHTLTDDDGVHTNYEAERVKLLKPTTTYQTNQDENKRDTEQHQRNDSVHEVYGDVYLRQVTDKTTDEVPSSMISTSSRDVNTQGLRRLPKTTTDRSKKTESISKNSLNLEKADSFGSSGYGSLIDNGDHEFDDIIYSLQAFQKNKRMSSENLAEKSVEMTRFAAKFIASEKGGFVTISSRNISLYVPPNALPTAKDPQLVYIYVSDDAATTPILHKEETWLTPTVRCGPPGLKFQKNVILTMPHCASEPQQWELCSHETKRVVEGGKWRRLDKDEDHLVFMLEKKMVMMLDHFCGEKTSGKGKDGDQVRKAMNVDVYMETSDQKERSSQLIVCLSNRYHGMIPQNGQSFGRHMTQHSTNFRWRPSKESLRYMNPDCFRDLCIALDFQEDGINGWTSVAGKLGHVRPAVVVGLKRQHRSLQSASTILLNSYFHRQGDVIKGLEFISEVFGQIGNKDAQAIVDEEIRNKVHPSEVNKLPVAENFQDVNNTTTFEQTLIQHIPKSYFHGDNCDFEFMERDEFREVALFLDCMDETGRGWTDVATKLGYTTPASVHALRENLGQSPSATMLRSYFELSRYRGVSTLGTLETFHGLCVELDIQDARVIFDKAIIQEERLVYSNDRLSASASTHNSAEYSQAISSSGSSLRRNLIPSAIIDISGKSSGTGDDVVVELKHQGQQDRNMGEHIKTKYISFSDIWSGSATSSLSVAFFVKFDVTTRSSEIRVYQENHEEAKTTLPVNWLNDSTNAACQLDKNKHQGDPNALSVIDQDVIRESIKTRASRKGQSPDLAMKDVLEALRKTNENERSHTSNENVAVERKLSDEDTVGYYDSFQGPPLSCRKVLRATESNPATERHEPILVRATKNEPIPENRQSGYSVDSGYTTISVDDNRLSLTSLTEISP